jgi:hypothetical protein
MPTPVLRYLLMIAAGALVACGTEPPPAAEAAIAETTTAEANATAPSAAAPAEPPAVPQAAQGAEAYTARAAALQSKLVPGADLAAARQEAEALMELGAALVPGFVARHPRCADYLDAALAVRSGWRAMDVETIERDYHHDGALPKLEDAGACYHMKDLVVHPATALVLLSAQPPDIAQAQAEIAEVVQHADFVGKANDAQ